jgi:UDP-2,3-diacylglucosamine pyrophosphatase LpxH
MHLAWVHPALLPPDTLPFPGGLGPAVLLAALLSDLVLRSGEASRPLYRRHLGLFGAWWLLSLGALALLSPPADPGNWIRQGLGLALWTALGLALPTLPWLRGRRLAGLGWQRGLPRRPDPSRPLILVADPHWETELTGLEAATETWPEADWLFLGDLFTVWIGLPGLETGAQRRFLDWVQARRRTGRWVGLWLGNRELFLDGLAPHFDLLGEGTGGALAEEGLAWEHGDLVNGRQWVYRLFYLVSRSGPLWLLARLLPARLGRALAVSIERSLRKTPSSHRYAFPVEAFRAAAEASRGQVFITGHFHTHEVHGKGVSLPWAHEGRFMLWRAGAVEPLASTLEPSPRPYS